jgi:glycine/D-amino acid oxidase-like deaminating enzyme
MSTVGAWSQGGDLGDEGVIGTAGAGAEMSEQARVSRRGLLQASMLGGGLLAACAQVPGGASFEPAAPLVPIRARTDRIIDIAVCLRPFRPAGPRVEAEHLGDTLVVHNYGHGGSGWSLSWGSSARAVRLAMQGSPGDVAVIGCGVLGLTSAILAQRAGARVTIYAREQLPLTTSARATGEWTPDSRIALADKANAGFATLWEEMARTAFKTHRDYLGLPGTPVEWIDQYSVTPDAPPSGGGSGATSDSVARPALDFASYRRRIADLTPVWRRVPADATPFKGAAVARSEIMIFNIADYGRTLLNDFFIAGGQFRRADFRSPSQIAALGRKVVINCTGYGARALWQDETLVPVRGQIARLIPQPDVRYGLVYRHVLTVPRRDGIVVQSFAGGDAQGYGDTSETPDRAEAERAVTTLAELFSPARSA